MPEEWICTDCERPYHEPPAECPVCGHPVVVPREEYESRAEGVGGVLSRARQRLLEPRSTDRDLLGDGPVVRTAFRLIVLVGVLVTVAVLVAVLLG